MSGKARCLIVLRGNVSLTVMVLSCKFRSCLVGNWQRRQCEVRQSIVFYSIAVSTERWQGEVR